MTERHFRLLLGSSLWLILTLGVMDESRSLSDQLYLAFIALMCFEGLTNIRITLLMANRAHARARQPYVPTFSRQNLCNWRDAERLLRLVVAVFLSLMLLPQLQASLWFMPWFVSGMLILAGVTNICPMVMMLQSLGLK